MNIKKTKNFSASKPYVTISKTRSDNPLLAGSMVNGGGDYVATFDLSRVCPECFQDEDNVDLDKAMNKFKELVKQNKDKFICLDFAVSDLSDGAYSKVLIVSTKREMSVRRVLSLLPKDETLPSVKATFQTAVTKGRYLPVTVNMAQVDDEDEEDDKDKGEEV